MLRLFTAIFFLVVCYSAAFASDTDASTDKVLILNSGHQGMPWTDLVLAGIEDQLKIVNQSQANRLDIYIENLDLFRKPATPDDQRLLKLAEKYHLPSFKLILTEGIPAAKLVSEHSDFYPLAGIYDGHAIINFNSVALGRGHSIKTQGSNLNTVRMINTLKPNPKRVIILGNLSIHEIQELALAVEDVLKIKAEIWFDDFTFDELDQRIQQLTVDDVVIYAPVIRDSTGKFSLPTKLLSKLTDLSPAPIFIFNEPFLGLGGVGGYLRSPREIGKRLIETAYHPSLTWWHDDFYYYGFDYEQLQRWNMDVSKLPDDRQLINAPEPGLWETFNSLFNQ